MADSSLTHCTLGSQTWLIHQQNFTENFEDQPKADKLVFHQIRVCVERETEKLCLFYLCVRVCGKASLRIKRQSSAQKKDKPLKVCSHVRCLYFPSDQQKYHQEASRRSSLDGVK